MPFRILVADQEKAIAETLAVIFSICGYNSLSACGGAQALSIAREFQPHVIISEVMMRNVNGIELLRQSRTLACRPKVILSIRGRRGGTARRAREIAGFSRTVLSETRSPADDA